MIKIWKILFLIVFFLNAYYCRDNTVNSLSEDVIPALPVHEGSIKVVSGNLVYVPAYSRVFSYKDHQTMSLVTTLAVHNTDPDHPLILRSVRYYSENGTLIKEYVKQARMLAPMATAIYHLFPEKPGVGIGSNAVVEWVSEYKIVKPIIEAIMISTEGTQGISFISPGYTIREIIK